MDRRNNVRSGYGASSAMNSSMSRSGFLRTAGLGAAAVGASMMGMSSVARSYQTIPPGLVSNCEKLINEQNPTVLMDSCKKLLYGATLKKVQAEQMLHVAINSSSGPFVDFEKDLARAVSAAIFNGDSTKVSFHGSGAATRFTLLRDGVADIVYRSCTNTATRDVFITTVTQNNVVYDIYSGFDFAPTYYYDGADVLINVGQDGAGARVAVATGTTTIDVLGPIAEEKGWELIPVGDTGIARAQWETGLVEGFAGDTSALIEAQLDPRNSGKNAYRYFVQWENRLLSKEPLAPVVRQDDPNWSDIVRWVMYVLWEAEEQGITQSNVTSSFGSGIGYPASGLPSNWAYNVIRAVGNYGEIYTRNLSARAWYPRGLNDNWKNGGLLYSPAFR